MSLTFVQLFAPNLVDNAAPETLYAVPTTPTTSLLKNARVRFSNVTAGAVTIKAWCVPPAGSATDTNTALPTTSIAANSYLDVDIPQMGAGYELQAQAGAASSINAQSIDGVIYA